MAAGPQRARLDTALTGAFESAVEASSAEWNRCVSHLWRISAALETASPAVKEQIGGQTGPAIDAAFARSSQGMTAKAEELAKGTTALRSAANAIHDARQEQQALSAQPLSEPGPYHKPVGPPTDQDLQDEAENRQAHARYSAAFADQERRAQEKADHMDRVFEHSTAVMKEIHRIPDPEPKPHGGDPGGGGPAGGGSGPAGGGRAPGPAGAPNDPRNPTPYHPPGPHGPGPGLTPYQPGPGLTPYQPGPGGAAPQGGTPFEYTPGSGTGQVPVSGSSGLSGNAGLGVAGAAAGGIGGGMLASGMAAGGIRGGLTPVVASPGTAASGVRGIGATGRAGVSGALGRAGGTSVTPTSAAAGRGTAAARAGASRTGAGGTAAGRNAAGKAGGRGAGARGSGTGGAATGRGGRRKDDEKGRKRDLFDAAEDWIDDEDAAPGVID